VSREGTSWGRPSKWEMGMWNDTSGERDGAGGVEVRGKGGEETGHVRTQ